MDILIIITVVATIKIIVLNRLFQKNENFYIYAYFLFKLILIYFSGVFAYYIRFNSFQLNPEYQLILIIFVLLNIVMDISLKKENFYSYSLFQFLQKDLANFTYTIIIIIAIGAAAKYTEIYSRLWIGIFISMTILFLSINKILFNFYHKKIITKSKHFIKNVMIVGKTNDCINFYHSFKNRRYHLKLSCIDRPSKKEKDEITIPHIYLDDNLSFNIKYHKINQVWVISSDEYSRKPILERFANIPVDIITVEDTLGISDNFIEKIDNYSLYQTSFTPFYGEAFALKIIFDFLISCLLILILSPLMILVSIIIYLEDGGPIIFKQSRHGWDGYPFYIYKFRSLKKTNSKKFIQVTKNDSRYLRSGKWLRKLSIDELPQLFNVVKGEMSLVGPRPHALAHNDEFSLKLRGFMQRHRCRPGITGLAQVKGFRGVTDTDEKMLNRYREDLNYIQNWSFSLDIKILIKTAFTFLLHNAD